MRFHGSRNHFVGVRHIVIGDWTPSSSSVTIRKNKLVMAELAEALFRFSSLQSIDLSRLYLANFTELSPREFVRLYLYPEQQALVSRLPCF